jgi:hypothetical protein
METDLTRRINRLPRWARQLRGLIVYKVLLLVSEFGGPTPNQEERW